MRELLGVYQTPRGKKMLDSYLMKLSWTDFRKMKEKYPKLSREEIIEKLKEEQLGQTATTK